jgi:peptidoglycan hydrolase-like protein with peptidoglycan-binding domain
MKRLLGFGLAALVLVALSGCGKKQEAEELQPITMESLSTVGTPAQPAVDLKAPEAKIITTSAVTPAKEAKEALPLPPQGPYKPTGIEIQTALKNAGFYTGNVDGKIGPKTKKAIEDFQKANGLKVDGKVGPKTWEAMSKHAAAAVEPVKR